MTNEEFRHYLNSLPPDTREAVLHRAKQLADYASRASSVRQKIDAQFPTMSPKLAGALSLVIARFT